MSDLFVSEGEALAGSIFERLPPQSVEVHLALGAAIKPADESPDSFVACQQISFEPSLIEASSQAVCTLYPQLFSFFLVGRCVPQAVTPSGSLDDSDCSTAETVKSKRVWQPPLTPSSLILNANSLKSISDVSAATIQKELGLIPESTTPPPNIPTTTALYAWITAANKVLNFNHTIPLTLLGECEVRGRHYPPPESVATMGILPECLEYTTTLTVPLGHNVEGILVGVPRSEEGVGCTPRFTLPWLPSKEGIRCEIISDRKGGGVFFTGNVFAASPAYPPSAPLPPSINALSAGGSQAVSLEWCSPHDNGSMVSGFSLELLCEDCHGEESDAEFVARGASQSGDSMGGGTSAADKGPWKTLYTGPLPNFTHWCSHPGCRGLFRVRARNAAGWGPWSHATLLASAPAPPLPPPPPSVARVFSTSVLLDLPSNLSRKALGWGAQEGFIVEIAPGGRGGDEGGDEDVNTSPWREMCRLNFEKDKKGDQGEGTRVSGLRPCGWYRARVRVVGKGGVSPPSPPSLPFQCLNLPTPPPHSLVPLSLPGSDTSPTVDGVGEGSFPFLLKRIASVPTCTSLENGGCSITLQWTWDLGWVGGGPEDRPPEGLTPTTPSPPKFVIQWAEGRVVWFGRRETMEKGGVVDSMDDCQGVGAFPAFEIVTTEEGLREWKLSSPLTLLPPFTPPPTHPLSPFLTPLPISSLSSSELTDSLALKASPCLYLQLLNSPHTINIESHKQDRRSSDGTDNAKDPFSGPLTFSYTHENLKPSTVCAYRIGVTRDDEEGGVSPFTPWVFACTPACQPPPPVLPAEKIQVSNVSSDSATLYPTSCLLTFPLSLPENSHGMPVSSFCAQVRWEGGELSGASGPPTISEYTALLRALSSSHRRIHAGLKACESAPPQHPLMTLSPSSSLSTPLLPLVRVSQLGDLGKDIPPPSRDLWKQWMCCSMGEVVTPLGCSGEFAVSDEGNDDNVASTDSFDFFELHGSIERWTDVPVSARPIEPQTIQLSHTQDPGLRMEPSSLPTPLYQISLQAALLPGRNYDLRVACKNALGQGIFSEPVRVRAPSSPPLPPTLLLSPSSPLPIEQSTVELCVYPPLDWCESYECGMGVERADTSGVETDDDEEGLEVVSSNQRRLLIEVIEHCKAVEGREGINFRIDKKGGQQPSSIGKVKAGSKILTATAPCQQLISGGPALPLVQYTTLFSQSVLKSPATTSPTGKTCWYVKLHSLTPGKGFLLQARVEGLGGKSVPSPPLFVRTLPRPPAPPRNITSYSIDGCGNNYNLNHKCPTLLPLLAPLSLPSSLSEFLSSKEFSDKMSSAYIQPKLQGAIMCHWDPPLECHGSPLIRYDVFLSMSPPHDLTIEKALGVESDWTPLCALLRKPQREELEGGEEGKGDASTSNSKKFSSVLLWTHSPKGSLSGWFDETEESEDSQLPLSGSPSKLVQGSPKSPSFSPTEFEGSNNNNSTEDTAFPLRDSPLKKLSSLIYSGPSHRVLLGGLKPGWQYMVRVRGVNRLGAGMWSSSHTLTLNSDVPSAMPPPLVLPVCGGSASSLRLLWPIPSFSNLGCAPPTSILSYHTQRIRLDDATLRDLRVADLAEGGMRAVKDAMVEALASWATSATVPLLTATQGITATGDGAKNLPTPWVSASAALLALLTRPLAAAENALGHTGGTASSIRRVLSCNIYPPTAAITPPSSNCAASLPEGINISMLAAAAQAGGGIKLKLPASSLYLFRVGVETPAGMGDFSPWVLGGTSSFSEAVFATQNNPVSNLPPLPSTLLGHNCSSSAVEASLREGQGSESHSPFTHSVAPPHPRSPDKATHAVNLREGMDLWYRRLGLVTSQGQAVWVFAVVVALFCWAIVSAD